MKLTLKSLILFIFIACMVFPTLLLCACGGDDSSHETSYTTVPNPDATNGDEQTTSGTESTDATTGGDEVYEDPTASLKGPIKDGAKILVVGNSYAHYGRFVIGKDSSVLTQEARSNDHGYLYQLCKQKGIDVNVTNWCFGSHALYDFFGGKCTIAGECFGVDHEAYLVDSYFDYVILSPSSGIMSEVNLLKDFEYVTNKFKAVNPDVKIICLGNLGARGYSSWMEVVPSILAKYKTLEDMGIIIADWGGIIDGIMKGTYKVPDSSLSYTESTFVVKDGFHPNMLSGYITALTAYCAITGESAVGQPYTFATNASLSSAYNTTSYISSRYNNPSDTNFPEVFKSEIDMYGIQQLVDQYFATKPYREIADYDRPNDFEDDTSKEGLLDGKKVIFIGNIYLYNGRVVTSHSKTELTQAERTIDKGYFSSLCYLYGSRVQVTNWTWDSHSLTDLFGHPCSKSGSCNGIRHEDYLTDRYFDYVVISPGSGEGSETNIAADFEYIMNFFKAANPNVKFVCIGNLGAYGYSSYGVKRDGILSYYKTLEDKGVAIADFGGLINGIITGKYTVPGATQTYNKMSFLVKNGYNVNPLTGYITTLMVYCAITGESAVGKKYTFWDNQSLNRNYVTSSYISSQYGTTETNFDDILESKDDIRGLQTLIDLYMTEKPWRS